MTPLIRFTAALAVAVCAIATVHSQPFDHPAYTQNQIKQMMRDAHTAQQCHDLAVYFRERQKYFEQQAQAEKIEWDRRSQITAGTYQKFPRPADQSRNRYEYFTYEAQQMAAQADRFDSLSAKSQ